MSYPPIYPHIHTGIYKSNLNDSGVDCVFGNATVRPKDDTCGHAVVRANEMHTDHVDKKVLWLEIAMKHAMLVAVGHTLE